MSNSSDVAELDPTAWTREPANEPLEINDAALRAVREMIKLGQRTQLVELLKRWDPVDVMQLLTRLRLKHARKLFQWLPANPSIKVIAELRPEYRSILMEESTLEQFSKFFTELHIERKRIHN